VDITLATRPERGTGATVATLAAAALMLLACIPANDPPDPPPTPAPGYHAQHTRVTQRGQDIADQLGTLSGNPDVADHYGCTTAPEYGGVNGYQVIGFWQVGVPHGELGNRVAGLRQRWQETYRVFPSPGSADLLAAWDPATDLDMRVSDLGHDVAEVMVTGQCYPYPPSPDTQPTGAPS